MDLAVRGSAQRPAGRGSKALARGVPRGGRSSGKPKLPSCANGRRQVEDEEKRRESKEDEATSRQAALPAAKTNARGRVPRKPVRVRRPKAWSEQAEENFRLQTAGWRDLHEYLAHYEEPDRWPDSGFVKCLRVKKNGYYTYWRAHRELEDKHVSQVKIYEY